jgi:hypothetical protein
MLQVLFVIIVVIYALKQLLNRWGKMTEEYKGFNSMMNAFMGWGAVILVLVTIFETELRLYSCTIFTAIFWIITVAYFYRKTHKKTRETKIELQPSIVPLTPEKIEKTKPEKVKHPKLTFAKNFFFIVLGIIESVYLLSTPFLFWEIVTIPVEGVNIAVMTYQNGLLILSFVLGLYIAGDMIRRLRHPRQAFFEE